MRERYMCPRRAATPFYEGVGKDWWDHRRWGTALGRGLAWWIHNGPIGNWLRALQHRLWVREWHRLRHLLPNPYIGGTRWEWGPWQPRVCSFCGGVHLEDAIRLVSLGWSLNPTDKGYKFYLEPRNRHWGPVPPVKLYTHHLNLDQVLRLIEVVKANPPEDARRTDPRLRIFGTAWPEGMPDA
jgi:hypothetical protein